MSWLTCIPMNPMTMELIVPRTPSGSKGCVVWYISCKNARWKGPTRVSVPSPCGSVICKIMNGAWRRSYPACGISVHVVTKHQPINVSCCTAGTVRVQTFITNPSSPQITSVRKKTFHKLLYKGLKTKQKHIKVMFKKKKSIKAS